MKYLIVAFLLISLLISNFICASEEENYRYYFTRQYLREKFSLSGGEKGYYYRQRRFEDAREKDFQILRDLMERNCYRKDDSY